MAEDDIYILNVDENGNVLFYTGDLDGDMRWSQDNTKALVIPDELTAGIHMFELVAGGDQRVHKGTMVLKVAVFNAVWRYTPYTAVRDTDRNYVVEVVVLPRSSEGGLWAQPFAQEYENTTVEDALEEMKEHFPDAVVLRASRRVE